MINAHDECTFTSTVANPLTAIPRNHPGVTPANLPPRQPASIPAVYSTAREDLYVILTALEPDGSATLKIYRNPLVNWIWIGGAIFVLGTLLVMWPHPRSGGARNA